MFIMLLLAIWRFTHLISLEDGPFHIFEKLRYLNNKPFSCFYCLSMWTSFLPAVYFSSDFITLIIYWFALSGGAIILEKLSDRYV